MVDSMMYFLCFWMASAAVGAFTFLVVRPRLIVFRDLGQRERDRLWAVMDQVAMRKGFLQNLGQLVATEQAAFTALSGAASLESLERRNKDFQQAGWLIVALEVEVGHLEAEIELVEGRHGRLFHLCFMRSTVDSATRMCNAARQAVNRLLVPEARMTARMKQV